MNRIVLLVTLVSQISIIHHVIPILARQSEVHNSNPLCENIPNEDKFDCSPRDRAGENSCTSKGCCWRPSTMGSSEPWCFFPKNFRSYVVSNMTKSSPSHHQLILKAINPQAYRYPKTIEVARVEINYETKSRLRINITDAERQRFKPPYPQVPIVSNFSADSSADYEVLIKEDPFGFAVIRKKTQRVIFDTRGIGGLTLADQFLQISSQLPTKYLYGLGERRNSFLINTHWETITLFNHDNIPQDNKNLYGSHPFYLAVEDDGLSHGIFLLNSNAMDIIIQPSPAITYRTIGGVLDFYFFLGPTPADVIKQYLDVIGYPIFPPYWSFGFNLCRYFEWGWKTLDDAVASWKRTRNAQIPFDVMWNDIDYMDGYNDFTLNPKYTGLSQFVDEIHETGMKYVIILDPGVASKLQRGTYSAYDEGLKLDIFIKNSSGLPSEGDVWNEPKGTVFPDFSNPKTAPYWCDLLSKLHEKINYDGLWLDMNEIANMKDGSIYGCPGPQNNSLDYPPYTPQVVGSRLNHKTLCMSDKHAIGSHYDVHNIYALLQCVVTNECLQKITNKRPLILTRSSFAGSGHYAIHWTGDVRSTWDEMKHSIIDIINFNLFGIPMVGADICGFLGNTTKELCQRWSQLGAFYPFSRNHNENTTLDQDPAVWGADFVRSTKEALLKRYCFLPYFYTLFWRAHQYGETVIRPLFFDFPSDKNTLTIDTQFMWGPALLIVPVLTEGATSVNAFFPKGVWVSVENPGDKVISPRNGVGRDISAPISKIPLYVRGGFIIPQQEAKLTTSASRQTNFKLLIVLDENQKASGSLFWDDGESFLYRDADQYNLLEFNCMNSTLTSTISHWGYNVTMRMSGVDILGLTRKIIQVKVNGHEHKFETDIKSLVTHVPIYIDMFSLFKITWTY